MQTFRNLALWANFLKKVIIIFNSNKVNYFYSTRANLLVDIGLFQKNQLNEENLDEIAFSYYKEIGVFKSHSFKRVSDKLPTSNYHVKLHRTFLVATRALVEFCFCNLCKGACVILHNKEVRLSLCGETRIGCGYKGDQVVSVILSNKTNTKRCYDSPGQKRMENLFQKGWEISS